MNKKSIRSKLAIALVLTTLLYGCSNKTETNNNTKTQTSTAKASIIGDKAIKNVIGELVKYDAEDDYTDWKSENPSYIELNGSTASVKGVGTLESDSKVTITSAGTYVVSGKLDNGQIIVDVKNKGKVRLVLNGAEISCSDNAPIYIKNAGKTIISLEAGTENTVTDGTKYTLADASTDEPNAAIFSKDNLVINGTGKLTVNGNYKDGIKSKDDLKITGGNIQITSVDDGLVGRDILAVKEGNINIKAGKDAMKSTNDEDAMKGIVAVENGTFNLKAENDGIQAETAVLISDGSFTITSGGGSANGLKKADEGMKGPMGDKNNNNSTNTSETESKKAIKAVTDIGIAGGTFVIDSADDSIHSNNNICLEGGDFTIASGDDGIHADANIGIKGGKINITKSYEGIESAVITVSDGKIYVTSSDDGINIAGGADSSSINGRPGQNNFASSQNNKLNINGGYIVVNSSGDGLDANGSIYMTKGTVVVYGPTSDGNSALDYDGTFEMTGGLLVASGSSRMAQAPSESSAQYSIIMTYPKVQDAGNLVSLQDKDGKSIATFAPVKDYQSVVISSPELKKGESYTLYSGGKSTGTETDGLYNDGIYENGTKVVSFTVSSSVTWLDESGVTTSKNFMQGGGHEGPNGQRPQRPQDQNFPGAQGQAPAAPQK